MVVRDIRVPVLAIDKNPDKPLIGHGTRLSNRKERLHLPRGLANGSLLERRLCQRKHDSHQDNQNRDYDEEFNERQTAMWP
jgi:hypothetical protein